MSFSICVLAIGKAKKSPEASIVDRYRQRIAWPIAIQEYPADGAQSGGLRKRREAEKLTRTLDPDTCQIALDENGTSCTSRAIANLIHENGILDARPVAFIIGGPDGLDGDLLAKVQRRIAFGHASLPHMLVRCIVMEQIYRAQTILCNHPYHRG
ncbi:MAG: 23S rRNA (pseudouridine(1915)-N(3))-methyltransferase RlmH [Pseudomonadota bacterium]